MRRVMSCRIAVLCAVGLAMVGCTTDERPTSAAVPITGHAVLDISNATITLPLAAYGMTPRETQLAGAAASIVFARCVTGQHDVSPSVMEAARHALDRPEPAMSRWLFGYWNAEYIAKNGWLTLSSAYPAFVKTDNLTGKRCGQADDIMAILPISTIEAPGEKYDMLIRYSGDASERTLQDPRYAELRKQLGNCVAEKGYKVDARAATGGVTLDGLSGSEAQLRAVLAEATCNDGLRLTQQAGDIDATYQQEYIKAHEAELIAIKRNADERVAKAREILREVGLL